MQIETLQKLIRIPSLSGKEQNVQRFINGHFQAAGLTNEQLCIQGENLIVHLAGKNRKKAFMVIPHVDVVSPGENSQWIANDPYSGEVVGDKMYGRGACDTKANVYASMEAATTLFNKQQAGETLPCDVWFVYAVGEEFGHRGISSFGHWFKDSGYEKQYSEGIGAIFAEPTNLHVLYGHKGNYFFTARTSGEKIHTSLTSPETDLALRKMVGFLQSLDNQQKKWDKIYDNKTLGSPIVVTTNLQTESTSPNQTPLWVEAKINLRTIKDGHEKLAATVQKLAENHLIELKIDTEGAPVYCDPESPLIKALQIVVPGTIPQVFAAASDLRYFQELVTKVQGVIWGAGDLKLAHQINENVSINEVMKSIDILLQWYYAFGA